MPDHARWEDATIHCLHTNDPLFNLNLLTSCLITDNKYVFGKLVYNLSLPAAVSDLFCFASFSGHRLPRRNS